MGVKPLLQDRADIPAAVSTILETFQESFRKTIDEQNKDMMKQFERLRGSKQQPSLDNAIHNDQWSRMCGETAPSDATVAVCLIQISGPCDEFPNLGFETMFFNDEFKGGPPASTEANCHSRMITWRTNCKSEEEEVRMKFVHGPPGPTIYRTPRIEDTYVAPLG
jgi:hypothetical protein